ncbi:hypothetical protein KW850_04475 [Bacillus sp. sid0103]|uniref:hypothetical protein n=1 Tax=Bacillus sp. sid0103 TaxID=2856337 RepID=UPI001C4950CE|nr:hypothetical protein [Bacillus sp. sid0103]MBV7504522.1 hypothetical protein [Bacillus sp. sid0103]
MQVPFGHDKQEMAECCLNGVVIRTATSRKSLNAVRMEGVFGHDRQEMAEGCPNVVGIRTRQA